MKNISKILSSVAYSTVRKSFENAMSSLRLKFDRERPRRENGERAKREGRRPFLRNLSITCRVLTSAAIRKAEESMKMSG
jgi:hypothetical protein